MANEDGDTLCGVATAWLQQITKFDLVAIRIYKFYENFSSRCLFSKHNRIQC